MIFRALIIACILSSPLVTAQQPGAPETVPDNVQENGAPAPMPPVTLKPRAPDAEASQTDLPDAPSATVAQQQNVVVTGKNSLRTSGRDQEPCNLWYALGAIYFDPEKMDAPRPRCSELVYPYQRFLSSNVAIPLNWKQKGYLAAHYTTDPASLGTIVGIAAITVAADSHTAYGPGLGGFGKLAGYSLLQNATAEFFGTFAVPAIMHQDPRYYRRPNLPIKRRILYSVTRSFVSRHDDGHAIPNYGVLATYPIVGELANLYVPGIQTDGASTAERILTGLALDPVNNLVNEFLPDVAKHIHVRIIFAQQILNNIAVSGNGVM